jgi:hypothetical protein
LKEMLMAGRAAISAHGAVAAGADVHLDRKVAALLAHLSVPVRERLVHVDVRTR